MLPSTVDEEDGGGPLRVPIQGDDETGQEKEQQQSDGRRSESRQKAAAQPKRNEDEKGDEILVTWDGDDDPENPLNWSTSFKCWVTLHLSLLAFSASLASSIVSPANRTIAEYIGVSQNVVVLNVSLYV